MCIRVHTADDLPDIVVWDPDEVSMLVARGAHLLDVVRELRALLTVDLGAPEGTGTALLCFCGEERKCHRHRIAEALQEKGMKQNEIAFA